MTTSLQESVTTKIKCNIDDSIVKVLWENKITNSLSEAKRLLCMNAVVNFDNNEILTLHSIVRNVKRLKVGKNKYYEIEPE